MTKDAFFDFDGTIAAPRFNGGSGYVIGFNPPDWVGFCNERREHAYERAAIIWPSISFAEKLKARGVRIRILTVTLSEGERIAKDTFLREHGLDRLFDEIIFVGKDADKTPYILDYARANRLDPDECMLVEDNFNNCLEAHNAGISAVHLSNLVTDTVSR